MLQKFMKLAKLILGRSPRARAARLQRRITAEVLRALAVPQPGFPETLQLPEGYGRGLPERVVEVLLAELVYRPGARVLDVGHANAMPCHLDMIRRLEEPKDLTGIDIAPAGPGVARFYRESIRGDIARTGFADDSFDLVWCISALEHFGMDNSGYTDSFSQNRDLAVIAIKEMHRVVKPGGTILVTVPYGQYEDHGWLLNYDQKHLNELLSAVRAKSTVRELYFRHTSGDGWVQTVSEKLAFTGYYDQANSGSGGLAAIMIVKNVRP